MMLVDCCVRNLSRLTVGKEKNKKNELENIKDLMMKSGVWSYVTWTQDPC